MQSPPISQVEIDARIDSPSSIPIETKLSKRSETSTDDPFGERRPTSHERMTRRPWDASYRDGPAPWDVGQPQPAVVRLVSEGGFAGAVLDVSCGTGENALHVASLGLQVLAVDVADTAGRWPEATPLWIRVPMQGLFVTWAWMVR